MTQGLNYGQFCDATIDGYWKWDSSKPFLLGRGGLNSSTIKKKTWRTGAKNAWNRQINHDNTAIYYNSSKVYVNISHAICNEKNPLNQILLMKAQTYHCLPGPPVMVVVVALLLLCSSGSPGFTHCDP